MRKPYLAFKPISTPLPQAFFRAENVKLIHTASFPHDWFSSYDFAAKLGIAYPNIRGENGFKRIKSFLKARGGSKR